MISLVRFKSIVFFTIFVLTMKPAFSAEVFRFVNKGDLLRLELSVARDQIVIVSTDKSLVIKTLNILWFNKVKKELKLKQNSFVKKIIFQESNKNRMAMIKIFLKSNMIESFAYFRDREEKQVIDFWKSEESQKKQKIGKNKIKNLIKLKSKYITKNQNKISRNKINKNKNKNKKIKELNKKIAKQKKLQTKFRDFRYGAPFIWDYEPMIPKAEAYLNIALKTPEYFFPIKNVQYDKSKRLSHMQLSINLYRKKKWGLMYKSIDLYQRKYGTEDNYDLNLYLKINAVLRQNLNKGNSKPPKMVISNLDNVFQKTKNYALKKAIYKYLLSYFLQQKEFITVLKLSKQFYVLSKQNFDYEESPKAIEFILNSLANLGQLNQIEKLSHDKTVSKIVPKQLLFSYQSYILLKLKEYKKLNVLYNKYYKGMQKPLLPSLLFNLAESFFEQGQINKSTKLFDAFIVNYSQLTRTSDARLRIALAYEMQQGKEKKSIELYKSVINHSTSKKISIEARIRLVALLNIRNKKPSAKDKEYKALLNFKDYIQKYIKSSSNLSELLWLVKLRIFIVKKQFRFALNYLEGLPLIDVHASKALVFMEDGSEVVYGIIQHNYQIGNYAKAISIWDIYKEKYLDKVANDPYLNFIIGESYLRQGLLKAFDKAFLHFVKYQNSPTKNYPVWIARRSLSGTDILLKELRMIKFFKQKNYKLASDILNEIISIKPKYPRNHFYRGNLLYNQKKFKKAAKQYELFLLMGNNQKKLMQYITQDEFFVLLNNYVESIYFQNDTIKFVKVANALLKDIQGKGSKYFKFKLKLNYQLIEVLFAEQKKYASDSSNLKFSGLLKQKIKLFKTKYGYDNSYGGRVKYLYSQVLINENNVKKAKEILNEIINGTNIATYLKEMAKTDLSLINIKERKL